MVYEAGKNEEVAREVVEEGERHSINSTSWGAGEYTLYFFGITLALRPKIAVELGVYEGFTSYWIASALMANSISNSKFAGHLYSYDLWEEYPYRHVPMQKAKDNLKHLSQYITLIQKDASKVHEEYADNSVDLLVIDLSNDGTTYSEYLFNWYPKLTEKAIVLMEGGSPKRDEVDWMRKYDKEPILKTLRQHPFLLSHYNYAISETYPGLTTLVKKEFAT
jgi:predicted O-methyltransferase YrrM